MHSIDELLPCLKSSTYGHLLENLLATSSSRGLAIIYQLPTCNMSTGPGLESLVDQTISVITNDGRNIVGVLKGFDQATNIILDESHERVYSTKEGVQQLVLGLYIIRGDNISIVGELDEELDSSLDLSKLRAHPLKPVTH
uniref:U6 snRNA-associated Sm-like protein LSm8 n=2 Tax=Vitis TaxID=3603 RepID=F6HE76_VITVI